MSNRTCENCIHRFVCHYMRDGFDERACGGEDWMGDAEPASGAEGPAPGEWLCRTCYSSSVSCRYFSVTHGVDCEEYRKKQPRLTSKPASGAEWTNKEAYEQGRRDGERIARTAKPASGAEG